MAAASVLVRSTTRPIRTSAGVTIAAMSATDPGGVEAFPMSTLDLSVGPGIRHVRLAESLARFTGARRRPGPPRPGRQPDPWCATGFAKGARTVVRVFSDAPAQDPETALRRGKPRRDHREGQSTPGALLRGGLPARRSAARHAGGLSAPAAPGRAEREGFHPLGAESPRGDGSATRAAPAGDEGHGGDRRHLAAATSDGAAGRAADDPGDRARAADRLGRGRRPSDHRERPAPPDDRGGDATDGGLEDLRRLLPGALL